MNENEKNCWKNKVAFRIFLPSPTTENSVVKSSRIKEFNNPNIPFVSVPTVGTEEPKKLKPKIKLKNY